MPPQPPLAAIRVIIRVRDALHRAGDVLMPAEWVLLEQTFGIARTQVIGAMAQLGVADQLSSGPRTAEQLAGALGADADALHRVLRAAAAFGLLALDDRGRFRLTRLSRRLRTHDAASLRDWARYMALGSTTDAYAALPHTLRTGEPGFLHARGMSVWQWLAEHPDEEAHFAGGMRRVTQLMAPAIVAGYPWPESGTVCDVAGGVGTLLAAVLAARPGLRGVLVDAAGPLQEADRFLRDRGVRDRVELVRGDIFSGVSARADCFVLKDVLHDWDDERCRTILRTVRATMQPRERVLLVETLQERNDPDLIASLTDLQMLTQCDGGRQRAEADLHRLLRETGFQPGPTHPTAGPALVEATAG
jgi:O-methyltransferase/methyltransferase family protein